MPGTVCSAYNITCAIHPHQKAIMDVGETNKQGMWNLHEYLLPKMAIIGS